MEFLEFDLPIEQLRHKQRYITNRNSVRFRARQYTDKWAYREVGNIASGVPSFRRRVNVKATADTGKRSVNVILGRDSERKWQLSQRDGKSLMAPAERLAATRGNFKHAYVSKYHRLASPPRFVETSLRCQLLHNNSSVSYIQPETRKLFSRPVALYVLFSRNTSTLSFTIIYQFLRISVILLHLSFDEKSVVLVNSNSI